MKKLLLSLATVAALTASAVAGGSIAEVEVVPEPAELTGFYLGAGYTYFDTSFTEAGNDFKADMNNDAGMVLAGYNFNEYVALEGRYTFIAAGDVTFAGYDIDELDGSAWGVYVKPQYPVSDDVKVYALLGYASATVESTIYNESADVDGFSYGLGVAYNVTKNVEVFADWTKIADDEMDDSLLNANTDAYTVGVNYKF